MDKADDTVDIAHDDVRGGRARPGELGAFAERPGAQRTDGGGWSLLSPTMRGALAGNPLRVRL